jgi:hypothetical protein
MNVGNCGTVFHTDGTGRAQGVRPALAIPGPALLFLLGLSDAGVAQLVEHLICNQRVGGSIPSASSTTSSRQGSEAEQFRMLKSNGLVSLDTSPFCVFVDWPRKCRSHTSLGNEFASRGLGTGG